MSSTHYLYGRKDRLGANILGYAAQLCASHHAGSVVRYRADRLPYADSMFVRAMFACCDRSRRDGGDDSGPGLSMFGGLLSSVIHSRPIEVGRSYAFRITKKLNPRTGLTDRSDLVSVLSSAVRATRSDVVSYFKTHFLKIAGPFLEEAALASGPACGYDPRKAILIHLRLEDVRSRPDYDGRVCSDHYRALIEADVPCFGDYGGPHNMQSPLSLDKLRRQIDRAMKENPGRDPVALTVPGERLEGLDCPYIGSDDPNRDLLDLSRAEVSILSRSTFALSSLLFGNQQRAYVPIWGHAACLGLDTRFDHSRYDYFY